MRPGDKYDQAVTLKNSERKVRMASFEEIEKMTKVYSESRDLLAERVNALNEEVELLKKQKLPGIRKTLAKVAEAESNLRHAIEESGGLFVKPKTIIFHGIKVGFQKGKGKMSWEDPDVVVSLIKKHFPDQADILIRTKESPDKKALDDLDVKDLRKLGITVEETGDTVVIKPVVGEVEKMVDAFLKELVNNDEEAA